MLKAVPLIITTGFLLSIFIAIFAQNQLSEVRRQWKERRCEPLVMLMANMVPDGSDPSIDPSDFAAENFNFCIGRFIDASLKSFLAPVLKIFDKQLDVTGVVQQGVNNLRSGAASMMGPFTSIMDTLWLKFKGMSYQGFRIFYKLYSALDRVMGIITASLFAGMSMYVAIQNTIKFVINVILIILGILVVLVIFLWFVLFPFIPIIITTIGIVTVAVGGAAGAAAASMKGSFCVAPGTLVEVQEGKWKPVESLQPGEGQIEGLLETIVEDQLYLLHGILLAGSHLVEGPEKKWIFVKEHPDAKEFSGSLPEKLYCLNTTTRTWKVWSGRAKDQPILLRDWEELPENDSEEFSWEMLIYELLNRQAIVSAAHWSCPGRGLLGPETQIWVQGKGPMPLSDVKIGDWVQDLYYKGGEKWYPFTRVLGVYKDISEMVPRSGPNGAAWCWLEGKNIWRHPPTKETLSKTSANVGHHLITESGTFVTGDGVWMRDFTEVGWDRIEKTYSFTSSRLNLDTFKNSR